MNIDFIDVSIKQLKNMIKTEQKEEIVENILKKCKADLKVGGPYSYRIQELLKNEEFLNLCKDELDLDVVAELKEN